MTQEAHTALQDIIGRIAAAGSGAEKTPLRILGSGSKDFLGRTPVGTPLSTAEYRGIVEYEPKELIITARCGTPLAELEETLAGHGQMLPFDPPHFGPSATLGGTLATGLSGPRRSHAGSARDFVLGLRLVDGQGQALGFGGKVIKNVAGYDISRLMTGAMGSLGVLLEASLKLVPIPARECTLVREHTFQEAIELANTWAGRPLPLSGSCFHDGRLYLRLSGSAGAVGTAREKLGGETLEEGQEFWAALREHRHPFFAGYAGPLWRISVPPATPFASPAHQATDPAPGGRRWPFDKEGKERQKNPVRTALTGEWLMEWEGGQRWLKTDRPSGEVRDMASAAGGHATLFRGGDRTGEVFHPLSPVLAEFHRRLKQVFDPHGILNPGRFYSDP